MFDDPCLLDLLDFWGLEILALVREPVETSGCEGLADSHIVPVSHPPLEGLVVVPYVASSRHSAARIAA